jgi:hypothetical protein
MPEYVRDMAKKAGLGLHLNAEGEWVLTSAGNIVHTANNPEDVAAFVKAWAQHVR